MSDPVQNILVCIDETGEIDAILGDEGHKLNIRYIDQRELANENEWYARDTLVEAENYPTHWKHQVDIEQLVAMVENAGIEPPAWVRDLRNERLLKSLADLEAL